MTTHFRRDDDALMRDVPKLSRCLRAERVGAPTAKPHEIGKRRISSRPDATTPTERAAVRRMIVEWEAKEALCGADAGAEREERLPDRE